MIWLLWYLVVHLVDKFGKNIINSHKVTRNLMTQYVVTPIDGKTYAELIWKSSSRQFKYSRRVSHPRLKLLCDIFNVLI